MTSSGSTTDGSEKMVHSRAPAPSLAKILNPLPPSDSESEDASDSSTPPPKKHHLQGQKKEQQLQKKEQDQLPPPSSLQSAYISNKTAATKTSVKRPRYVENVGTPELTSTKKKATVHTVKFSDTVPEKKKAQKEKVAVSVRTPSLPQKSGKKAIYIWNPKDELAFLYGLLAFTKEGQEVPNNMSPFYDYVRDTINIHCSNKQFRGKLRRLKAKFQVLVENMGVDNYIFKSPDEAAMYEISKQLWGVKDKGDDEHRYNAETVNTAPMNVDEKKKKKQALQAEEEDGEKFKDGDKEEEEEDGEKCKDGEQGEEQEGEDEPKRDKTMTNALVKNSAGDVDRLREERDDMANEMKNTVTNILKESETKTKPIIEGHLLNTRADHVQSLHSDMMTGSKSDMMTGIYSGRRAPVSNKVKAKALEEKWRKQQNVETKAFLERLDLLQEECDIRLEELGEPVGRDRCHITE